jgi:hypothetical protein
MQACLDIRFSAWTIAPPPGFSLLRPCRHDRRCAHERAQMEHRYFGESMPFGNNSFLPANIGYLSPEQALADYANFLQKFKASKPGAADCPVLSIGGSYGGRSCVCPCALSDS